MITMSKRELLARTCARSGLTRALEALPKVGKLLVINYHRVGNRLATPYDPGTFSSTAEELDAQVSYLKRHFSVVSLPESLALLAKQQPKRGTAVLITFDDGYLDNYSAAFPVLRSRGVSATFFLPTRFVGTGILPWWDIIAYQVRRSGESWLRLPHYGADFELSGDRETTLMRVLRLCKAEGVVLAEFLSEITEATKVQPPGESAERCFLNWAEAMEMQDHGMYFGSHTHNHEILSKLPENSQLEELRTSREIIEGNLKQRCEVLAYPVGKRDTFSAATVRALRGAGYIAAFSFYGGVNYPGRYDPYNILRHGIDGQSMDRIRLQTAAVSAFGRGWV
jgi:peptidoglycan/xylan/chitin deacetylase (PgdA/CDA1 family)